MKTELELKKQKLTLFRYPKRKNETLQAWNAADEYLISEILSMNLEPSSKVLIVNDSFGALGCGLNEFIQFQCGDSFISQKALMHNLIENNLSKEALNLMNPMDELPSDIDLVVIKLPKSHALLEYQLIKISQQLRENIKIISAAMTKEIHSSTLQLFDKIIGPSKTSLAKKKARLIFSELKHKPIDNPYPKIWQLELADNIFTIENQANLFSINGLDQGSRFMLENLPAGDFKKIIDLGCGNGVLGLVAGSLYHDAKITFVDESYMAVYSSHKNWLNNFPDRPSQAEFKVDNCLDDFTNNSADLILCNPPFHQQQTITDHIAMQMFSDSKRVLQTEGRLLVIGNRHLGYHIKLKKWFKQVNPIASNSKFVIFEASN